MNVMRRKSVEQTLADASEPGRMLKRSLSAWDLTIMGVAVAVGAGIFSVGAKAAARYAGPAVSVSFIVAALVCAAAVMCYAEFATALPVAGSAYVYTYATLGELVAWVVGWNLILELLMAGSVIAKYWGIYLAEFFQAVDVALPASVPVGPVTLYWGPLVVVAVFTAVLIAGTKLSARVNNVVTVVKVLIVLFIIVVGLSFVKFENYAPFVPPSQEASQAVDVAKQPLLSAVFSSAPSMYGAMGLISGAALVFFAFVGFDIVATSAEEVKDPRRTLPRGIFGGLGIVTALYVLVTLTVTGMVSYRDLAQLDSPSLASAFQLVGAGWAVVVITLGSLIGLTTVIMVLLMGLARVLLALSRDGLLPRGLSRTSEVRATPVRLQVISGAVVALLAGFTPVDVLEEMINGGTLSAFVMVSVGVLVLRRRPGYRPHFRAPGGPVLPVLSALLCVCLMLNLAVETWVFFGVWLVGGLVLYAAYGYRHSRLGQAQRQGV